MSKQSKSRPFISIWFGNFFEPFYSDFEATRKGIAVERPARMSPCMNS